MPAFKLPRFFRSNAEQEIFEKVSGYILGDEGVANKCEEFMVENSTSFTEDEEHKLEYTAVYLKYLKLFEELLEGELIRILR